MLIEILVLVLLMCGLLPLIIPGICLNEIEKEEILNKSQYPKWVLYKASFNQLTVIAIKVAILVFILSMFIYSAFLIFIYIGLILILIEYIKEIKR